MSNGDTSHSPDLERLIGGEQDGLPPAPQGSSDDPDDAAPEDRFTPPADADLHIEESVTNADIEES